MSVRDDSQAAVWEAHDTTVAEVERWLGRLVRELACGPSPGPPGAPVHPRPRASVLNLVIHADEEGEAERAGGVVAKLATRHPSRTLLLVAAPDAPADGLDALVRIQRVPWPSGTADSCFELVRLVARGATALHLASVVEPLLVSNLPCFLWWLGRPPTSHDPLLELADRLIVDSAEFPDALAGLAALDACALAAERRLELGDLGWRRIAPWCQLLAQFFDPPDARPYQRRLRRVLIEYAPRDGGVTAAPLLLAGWLASRLAWEPETSTTARGALDVLLSAGRRALGRATDEVIVQIRPRAAPAVAPGGLVRVRLTAGPGRDAGERERDDRGRTEAAVFEVWAADDGTCAHTRAVLPGLREVEHTAPLGQLDTAELLADELERPVADPVYADALAMVGHLVR